MIATPDKLQIYPRGFLGRPLPFSPDVKATPFQIERKRKQFSLSLLDTPSRKRYGDTTVANLFHVYVGSEGHINSHQFREKVFLCAASLFASRDFYFWYQSQKASPLYGDYQKKFLEDTILYLATGKRELSVTSWGTLITVSTNVPTSVNEDPEFVKEFFGQSTLGTGQRVPKNRDIVDILQLWWSKPAGVGDLLYTLYILFGDIQ